MQTFSFIYLTFFGFVAKNVMGVTDAQKAAIQGKFLTGGFECIKDYPLSADDINAFKNKMIPDGESAKCFAACLFKKIGIMDDMGKLSQEGARASAKQVFHDEEHLKRTDELMRKCSTVNEQSVSDGNKGCDRAKLAFGCLAENAPKYRRVYDVTKQAHIRMNPISSRETQPIND